MKKEIKSGNITVSKARKITPVINKQNSKLWLEKAKSLSQKKLEKEVAKINPKTATPEKTTYVSENRLNLQLGVSEELLKKLRRFQDLLSQKKKKAVSLEKTLEDMVNIVLEKTDPVKKAKRILKKKGERNIPIANMPVLRQPTNLRGERKPRPAHIKHKIFLNNKGQCSHINHNNQRCSSQRWLDIHHIIPISHGGENSSENLKLLCSSHHRMMHLRH